MDSDWYEHVSAALAALGVAYRDLPLDTIADTLPMVRRDGLQRVVETAGAGLLFARRIVDDLVPHLTSLGVEFIPGVTIDRLDPARAIVGSGRRSWSAD